MSGRDGAVSGSFRGRGRRSRPFLRETAEGADGRVLKGERASGWNAEL